MSIGAESPLISISEIAAILKKKNDAAIKWLTEHKVSIHKFGKSSHVYKIDWLILLGTIYAKELRKTYPNTWSDKYRMIEKNEIISGMVIYELASEKVCLPTTVVKPINNNDKTFLKSITR